MVGQQPQARAGRCGRDGGQSRPLPPSGTGSGQAGVDLCGGVDPILLPAEKFQGRAGERGGWGHATVGGEMRPAPRPFAVSEMTPFMAETGGSRNVARPFRPPLQTIFLIASTLNGIGESFPVPSAVSIGFPLPLPGGGM